jgi:hypothetical protein
MADAALKVEKTKPRERHWRIIMSSSPSALLHDAAETEQTMAVTSPALTTEVFQHHMMAMKLHYQSGDGQGRGPSHAYALPIHLLYPFTEEGVEVERAVSSNGKAKVDAVMKKAQGDQTALVQRQRDFVVARANTLQSTRDTAAFAAAMEAQKQKAKAEADKQIDEQFDQLIKIGTEHPELQAPILSASQKIGAFLTSLLVKVGTFFKSIYNKILGWIKAGVKWLKDAATTAAQWASSAVSTVKKFFGSLF